LTGKLVHFLFDFFEIFRSERLIAKKFVEKAGVDRRPDTEFYVGIQLHHRSGEKMRGRVTKDVERVGIFFGEDLQLDVAVEGAAEIDQFAGAVALVAVVNASRSGGRATGCLRGVGGRGIGNTRDERSVSETRRYFARNIRRSCALRD